MAYISKTKRVGNPPGKKVRLLTEASSLVGKFTVGSIVTVTGHNGPYGYDFEDEHGNSVIESTAKFELVEDETNQTNQTN